jgi:hypothetical protein
MASRVHAPWFLENETRAMLGRLDRIKPLALQETVLPAAAIPLPAQLAIERTLAAGRDSLRRQLRDYLAWLLGEGRRMPASEAQRRYAVIRLAFNDVITELDLFSDVVTQRSESGTGVLLSGLDAFAADALGSAGGAFTPPPVVSYLDRGPGAAIRRARTRLPAGGPNPVAIVRVPRERMVGLFGLGASVAHEVGHQAAALLDLLPSLRAAIAERAASAPASERSAWDMWQRWVSEIVADFWGVAKLGVASTIGLAGVVSLPSWAVWRPNGDDPHPTPWVRVKLSCAAGGALYPHRQWAALARMWESLYPSTRLRPARRLLLDAMEATMPELVGLVLGHRPARLGGRSLREVAASQDREPARLIATFRSWQAQPAQLAGAPPTLAFAVLGQARAAGGLSHAEEERLIPRLLTRWALDVTYADVRPGRNGRARIHTPLQLAMPNGRTTR